MFYQRLTKIVWFHNPQVRQVLIECVPDFRGTMDFLKGITGKIITGAVVLGVIVAGISWWQAEDSTRQALLAGTGRVLSWLGIVLFIPWATFFLIGKVAKMESNLAGAVLVGAYTVLELLLLGWLLNWTIPSATAWSFFALGGLFAAVYNLFTCDWIAEKL